MNFVLKKVNSNFFSHGASVEVELECYFGKEISSDNILELRDLLKPGVVFKLVPIEKISNNNVLPLRCE